MSDNFTNIAAHVANARVDWGSDTFKAILVTAAPTSTQLETWEYLDDVTTEVSDADYTAGGFAVTASIGTLDTVNDRLPITYAASNPVYTAATITADGMIVYKDTTDAETSPLLHYIDFGGTKTTTDGDWTIAFDTPLYINA